MFWPCAILGPEEASTHAGGLTHKSTSGTKFTSSAAGAEGEIIFSLVNTSLVLKTTDRNASTEEEMIPSVMNGEHNLSIQCIVRDLKAFSSTCPAAMPVIMAAFLAQSHGAANAKL